MPEMKLHKNYVLTSKFGHSIRFKAGEVVNVPPIVVREAVAVGAVQADGSDANVLDDEEVKRPPSDPQERAELIDTAVHIIEKRNVRDDFTAAGHPTVEAVKNEVGFKVQAKEIAAVMQARCEAKGERQ